MLDKKIAKHSLAYAASAVAYVTLVATIMRNAERFLGQKEDMILMPIGFLLLLVTSAATMGLLVFGKPVMLYMDGQKREGVLMVIYTIASLLMFTVLLFGVMFLM